MILVITQSSELLNRFRPHEEVGASLYGNGARETEVSIGAQESHLAIALFNPSIRWSLRKRPAQIGLGVLMGAAHLSVVWQRSKDPHRPVHLGWRSFEESSATSREQCVTAEKKRLMKTYRRLGDKKSDMRCGVGRHVTHLNGLTEQLNSISVFHGDGLKRNSGAIVSSSNHSGRWPNLEQIRRASDVVGVVMGLKDGDQAEPPPWSQRSTGAAIAGSTTTPPDHRPRPR